MKVSHMIQTFENLRKKYKVVNRLRERLMQMTGKAGQRARFLSPFVFLHRENEFPMGVMQFGIPPLEVGKEIEIKFNATLYDYQEKAMTELLRNHNNCGLLCSPTGSGKTAMISNMICRKGKNALILVKNKSLMYQMKEELEKFTDAKSIGFYGDGSKDMDKDIVICIQKSFLTAYPQMSGKFSLLLVDEADCFLGEKTLDALITFKAESCFAFTATPYSDAFGEDVVSLVFGKITRSQYELLIPHIIVLEYQNESIYAENWHEKREALIDNNEERFNRQVKIINDLQKKFSHILILFDRVKTVNDIVEAIPHVQHIIGDVGQEERNKIISEFRAKGGLLAATEMTLGRGFNAPEINCVCLFFPNKFDGRVKQMVGRALRKKEGKGTPYIIDWKDSALIHQYRAREKAYRELWGDKVKFSFIR